MGEWRAKKCRLEWRHEMAWEQKFEPERRRGNRESRHCWPAPGSHGVGREATFRSKTNLNRISFISPYIGPVPFISEFSSFNIMSSGDDERNPGQVWLRNDCVVFCLFYLCVFRSTSPPPPQATPSPGQNSSFEQYRPWAMARFPSFGAPDRREGRGVRT